MVSHYHFFSFPCSTQVAEGWLAEALESSDRVSAVGKPKLRGQLLRLQAYVQVIPVALLRELAWYHVIFCILLFISGLLR